MVDEIKLKVREALQEEAYRGIVRIDSQTMKDIGVRPGDIVELEGVRKTVGIVDRAYPTDVGQAVIRMDGVLRRNAKTSLGEYVKVRRAEVKEAKLIVIAPSQKGVTIQADPIYFKRGLLGRALMKGDQVVLSGGRRKRRAQEEGPFQEIFDLLEQPEFGLFGFTGLKFIVVQADPKQAVIVTENTEVSISPKAVDVQEEKIVDVTYEDIGGLSDEVKKIREMVELPLKHPELFTRLGIDPPKGVLLHGPPGTGKTLLAKAVANETAAHFIHLDGPSVMCVGGETEILTNPDGRKTIAEMFNEAEKNGEVIAQDRFKKVIIPKEEIKVFAMNNQFDIVTDKVKSILKLDAEETYNIKTKKKSNFKTSKNQPFATLDTEGNILWKRAEDLKKGEYIAIAGEIKSKEDNPFIDWFNKLNKENFYATINGKDVSLKLVNNINQIKNLKYTILPKNINSAKEIIPIDNITSDFMEFLGAIYSDGWISEDCVGIADEKQEFRDRYKELFNRVFGIELSRIAEEKKKGGAKIVVYSTVLGQYLNQGFEIIRGKKPLDIKLPKWIFKCNKECISAFLRGYYHGDSTQGWEKSNYPNPLFYSKNREFLKDIQVLLLHLGIVSKIEYHKNKYGDMWKTVILDTEGRERFYENVVKDFKNSIFKKWFNTRIRKGSSEKLPNLSKTLKRLKTNLLIKYGKNINEQATERYISGRDKLTFRKLRFILDNFNLRFNEIKDQIDEDKISGIKNDIFLLTNIASGRIKWDVITETQRAGASILYDFTMETYGNFLGGNPLTVLHNSKYVGEAEKKIRDIFEEAEKNAPAIIFIDEIDAIASKREESYGEVERRVVAQLLATMDGLKARGRVIVIAATNRPHSIDQALRRPGRFDREIDIGVPKADGRKQILKIHTRNMPLVGTLYLDLLAKNILLKLDEKIFEITPNIETKKQEIKVLELEIKKLEKEKNDSDQTILNKIIATITMKAQRLSQLNLELNLIINNLNELENIKKSLQNDKTLINKISTQIKEIEDAKKSYNSNDPRIKVVENFSSEIYKKLSALNITNTAISLTKQEGIYKDVEELARITHGFVGADLEVLCKEAAMVVLRRLLPEMRYEKDGPIQQELLDELKINMSDFKEALKFVRPSALREVFIEKPTTTWNEIGGLEIVKQEIKEAVEWPLKYPQIFRDMGITPPKGILLYGPPGTGKTLLAKAAANESEANFILVNGPELLNKFVGESEKGVRKIFEKARQASPCIIFFDEIDSIASRRGRTTDNGVTERMVNQILTEIDGLQELNDVIVIGATNRPDIIDPALLRPGRFDRIILTPVPDDKSRQAILQIHTKGMPLAKDVDLNMLVELTPNFVGADIQSLCREAAIIALRKNMKAKEILMKDFEEALKKVRPSISQEDMKIYEEIEEEYLRTARGAAIREKDHLSYMG